MHFFHDFALDTVVYPAGLVMPRHDHPWTNVTAVIRGEILEQTDSAEHRGRSCSVVFKPAGTLHANRAIGPGPVVTIAIELRGGSELSRLAAKRPWAWMEGQETARAALRLQELIRTSPEDAEAAAQALLAVVLTPLQQRPRPPWLMEILEFVERDPAQPFSLRTIARRVGLHPAYVSRAFRRTTGRTLTGYVRDLRLGRARHLLSTTARPLLAVAADCGFTDASHLSRAFAGAHAVTPGAFRQICNAAG